MRWTPEPWMLGLFLICFSARGEESRPAYRLNGRGFPRDVAQAHRPLPALDDKHAVLLRQPNTNDLLEIRYYGRYVECRTSDGEWLRCSNGIDISIGTNSIQRLFQIFAETQVMLRSPQQPPPSLRQERTPSHESVFGFPLRWQSVPQSQPRPPAHPRSTDPAPTPAPEPYRPLQLDPVLPSPE